MIPLQIISLIFGLYMLYWSFLSYKKRLFYINELMFWISIWTLFITIALLPDSAKIILQTFRINRTMDLFMIIAFMVLWFISFRNYTDNKQLKKILYQMVREDAKKRAK